MKFCSDLASHTVLHIPLRWSSPSLPIELRDLVPLRAAAEQLGREQLQLFRRSNLAEKDVH